MERYERLKILGKGTFGKAWLVKDRESGIEYVAKEIKVENKQDLDDALAEANVLSRLNHVNIVKYQDVIRSSSKLVTIVMEYCDDGDVSEKIARRKFKSQFLEESLVMMWFVQTTQALDYIHKKGMIHRDIKTANLFLTKKGFIKLGDFGIARVLDRNAERVGQRTAKTPIGTPMYMSPEQCSGQKYTQKADIWALGCVLYEMATLRPAFMAHSMEGLMAKIKHGHHDKYMPKHLSANVNNLIAWMLNVEEKKRPSTEEILALEYLGPYTAQSPFVLSAGGSSAVVSAASMAPQEQKQQAPEVLVIDDEPQTKVLSQQSNWGASPAPSPSLQHRGLASPATPSSQQHLQQQVPTYQRGRASQPQVSPITGLRVDGGSAHRRASSPSPSPSQGGRPPPSGKAMDYKSWQQQQQQQQPSHSPLGARPAQKR